jgi:hypothetical protein
MNLYRFIALAVSVLSAAAMLNLGLYPIRAVLSGAPICPIFADGRGGFADFGN